MATTQRGTTQTTKRVAALIETTHDVIQASLGELAVFRGGVTPLVKPKEYTMCKVVIYLRYLYQHYYLSKSTEGRILLRCTFACG